VTQAAWFISSEELASVSDSSLGLCTNAQTPNCVMALQPDSNSVVGIRSIVSLREIRGHCVGGRDLVSDEV
jgi:hypothetical protein